MQAIKITSLTYIYSKKTPSEKVALDNVNLASLHMKHRRDMRELRRESSSETLRE